MPMRDEVTLTEEELESLNDGETVKASPSYMGDEIKIHPPCSVAEHKWGKPSVKKDDSGYSLLRKCSKCGVEQLESFDPDEMLGGE